MIVDLSAKESRKTKAGWAEYMRKYRKARPEIMHAVDLKKNYGMSKATYDDLRIKQDHKCAICGLPEQVVEPSSGKLRNLAVDHNHETGQIRGLLCTPCNRALGMFKDNPSLVEKALKYLLKEVN